jgi:hypothetical protein
VRGEGNRSLSVLSSLTETSSYLEVLSSLAGHKHKGPSPFFDKSAGQLQRALVSGSDIFVSNLSFPAYYT